MSNKCIAQLEKYRLKLILFEKQLKYGEIIKKQCNSYWYTDIVWISSAKL